VSADRIWKSAALLLALAATLQMVVPSLPAIFS
jgi:hypothetical protein